MRWLLLCCSRDWRFALQELHVSRDSPHSNIDFLWRLSGQAQQHHAPPRASLLPRHCMQVRQDSGISATLMSAVKHLVINSLLVCICIIMEQSGWSHDQHNDMQTYVSAAFGPLFSNEPQQLLPCEHKTVDHKYCPVLRSQVTCCVKLWNGSTFIDPFLQAWWILPTLSL